MGNGSSRRSEDVPDVQSETRLELGDIVRIKHADNNTYVWGICIRTDPMPTAVVREEQTPYAGWCIRELDIVEDMNYSIDNARDEVSRPKGKRDIVLGARSAIGMTDEYGPWRPDGNNDHTEFVADMRYRKEAVDDRLGLDSSGCSQWYAEEDRATFFWLLRRGDIVEFGRIGYSHFAICVQEPQFYEECKALVHRTTPDSRGSANLIMNSLIRRTKFEEATSDRPFRINNSCDGETEPRNVEDICDFALKSIGSKAYGEYNPFVNNCWHFVKQARYGTGLRKNVLRCDEWTTKMDEIESELTEGDLVEFQRPSKGIEVELGKGDGADEYEGWAVYVGILTPGRGVPELAYRRGGVENKAVIRTVSMIEFVSCIAEGCRFRINNKCDHVRMPGTTTAVAAFVKKYFGKEYPCEECGNRSTACPHFVQRARSGY